MEKVEEAREGKGEMERERERERKGEEGEKMGGALRELTRVGG